jgi:hypothetical protein
MQLGNSPKLCCAAGNVEIQNITRFDVFSCPLYHLTEVVLATESTESQPGNADRSGACSQRLCTVAALFIEPLGIFLLGDDQRNIGTSLLLLSPLRFGLLGDEPRIIETSLLSLNHLGFFCRETTRELSGLFCFY